MTPLFLLKVKLGKLLANVLSGFVRDREKRHRLRERLDPLNPERCVAYLERHYADVEPLPLFNKSKKENYIWVCWLQGEASAPSLVARCIASIRKFKQESQEVVVITEENYTDYLDLPKAIIEKRKRGIITNAHFSDILRIHLLACYGGCWLDATCLLTSPVPAEILSLDLFIYHTHGEFAFTQIQSCFLVAKPDNYVMRKWCAAIDAYWESESMLIHYFLLHLMFQALLHKDGNFCDAFEVIPYKTDEAAHALLYAMLRGERYSDELMEKAAKTSFWHKLTYKFDAELLNNPDSLVSKLSEREMS